MKIVLKDLNNIKSDIPDELYKILFTFYKLISVDVVSNFEISGVKKIEDILFENRNLMQFRFNVDENKYTFKLNISYGDKAKTTNEYKRKETGTGFFIDGKIVLGGEYYNYGCQIESFNFVSNEDAKKWHYWMDNIYPKINGMKESELKSKVEYLKKYINLSLKTDEDSSAYGCGLFFLIPFAIILGGFLCVWYYEELTSEFYFWLCAIVELILLLVIWGGFSEIKRVKRELKNKEKEIKNIESKIIN